MFFPKITPPLPRTVHQYYKLCDTARENQMFSGKTESILNLNLFNIFETVLYMFAIIFHSNNYLNRKIHVRYLSIIENVTKFFSSTYLFFF